MSAELSQAVEPLRLNCGHLLAAVVTSSEGRSYCSACAELAAIVQDEAEAEEDTDPEPVEGVVVDESLERQDGESGEGATSGLELAQPFHSTRSEIQGRRGCWAVSVKTGEPCGAPNVRGEQYCAAHLGRGVAGDPSRYASKGVQARKRNSAIRSELRMVYGGTRSGGVRQVLRGAVEREGIALAGRAVSAALDENADPIKAANLAVKLIETADPPVQAGLTVTAEQSIDDMPTSELLALAAQLTPLDATPPATPPAALTTGT